VIVNVNVPRHDRAASNVQLPRPCGYFDLPGPADRRDSVVADYYITPLDDFMATHCDDSRAAQY
jgi:hypothetical protein